MPADERVLCIPDAHFAAAGRFAGFRPADDAYRAALLDPAAFAFRPRSAAETDPGWKQLIPYVVLRCGESVFHYRRGSGAAETRLAAMRSVGVGGHISEADAAGGADPYRTGMRRELAEEVALGSTGGEHLLGFIYDDRTPVGRVHIGVVHVFDLREASAVPREAAIADAGFAPLADLARDRGEFETWSQFVFEVMHRSNCKALRGSRSPGASAGVKIRPRMTRRANGNGIAPKVPQRAAFCGGPARHGGVPPIGRRLRPGEAHNPWAFARPAGKNNPPVGRISRTHQRNGRPRGEPPPIQDERRTGRQRPAA